MRFRGRCASTLQKMGFDDETRSRPFSSLSGGQRTRLALCRQLCREPDILMLDEPTNGLDIIAARDVRDFILEMKAEGKCVIISTHLFDLVERICDRAAIIIDGKIVENNTLENIMNGRSLEDAFYDIYTEVKGDKENA